MIHLIILLLIYMTLHNLKKILKFLSNNNLLKNIKYLKKHLKSFKHSITLLFNYKY